MTNDKEREAIINCLNMIAYGVGIKDKDQVRCYLEQLNDLIVSWLGNEYEVV